MRARVAGLLTDGEQSLQPAQHNFTARLLKFQRGAVLTPKAIRLYEARGLLGPTRRSAAGYRLYRRTTGSPPAR